MGCYYPFLAIPDYENRSSRYKLVGPYEPDMSALYPGSVAVPCGKCLGCRLDYSRNWADRMMLEFDRTKKAIFLTLTYDDNHVHHVFDEFDNDCGLTLHKEDWQLFMKRLRSRKRFENTELRFYAAGEYGSLTHRPHMHAIIFGISLEDFPDRRVQKVNRQFNTLWTSPELEQIWDNGFILIGDVSWKTCAYVSRYVMKKATCELLPFEGCEPEFSLMSRNPGIGAYYFMDRFVLPPKVPCDFENVNLKVLEGGQKIKSPKYFLKLLENIDPVKYNEISEQRREFAKDAVLKKLQDTDLTYQQKLKIELDEKLRKTISLKRGDV